MKSFPLEPIEKASIDELRADLEAAIARGTLPPIPLEYVPAAVGAIAFEVAALMASSDPPDVQGATAFCAELFLGGIERLKRMASGTHVANGNVLADEEQT